MAQLGSTTVTSITSASAASGATELVRLGELTTLLAAHVPNSHTHTASEVTDFDESSLAAAIAALTDSDTVTWTSSSTQIQANVALKSGGGLASDASGVYVSFGADAGTAAEGNHTHASLHDAVTVSSTGSVAMTLAGQMVSATVTLKPDGGLLSDADGVYVDPDSLVAQSSGHNPVTATDTTSVQLTLGSDQELSAAVILGTPSTDEGAIAVSSSGSGLVVSLGTTSTTAAAGDHTHSEATSSAAGLLSASDKTKLDSMAASLQVEQAIQFHAADYLIQGDYVGGKVKWSQNMQLTNIDVIAKAPQASNVSLAIEIDGTNIVTGILLPTGTENAEVSVTLPMTDVFVTAGDYVRVVCESGVSSASDIEQAPSEVSVSINALPALTNVPEVKLNCGGTATSPFADDGYYNIGSTNTTTESIDLSGVTNPAPEAAYQCVRYYYASSNPVTYTIPYLGRGIDYKVRLHFAEIYFDSIGDQVFDILVTGEEEHTQSNYDILSETSGTQNQAVVKEFTGVRADSNGQITIKLTPVAPNFRWSINAIEIVQDV